MRARRRSERCRRCACGSSCSRSEGDQGSSSQPSSSRRTGSGSATRSSYRVSTNRSPRRAPSWTRTRFISSHVVVASAALMPNRSTSVAIDATWMPHDGDQDRVVEDRGDLVHVPDVERRLLAPALLALPERMTLEEAAVEVAQREVEFLFGHVEPLPPGLAEAPERDEPMRLDEPHDGRLRPDRNPRMAVEDQAELRRAGARRAQDEDRPLHAPVAGDRLLGHVPLRGIRGVRGSRSRRRIRPMPARTRGGSRSFKEPTLLRGGGAGSSNAGGS